MNKDRFVLYSLNYAPELTGIGKYNGEMVRWFADHGYHMDVVCAAPYYPEWKIHQGFSGLRYSSERGTGTHVIRCPLYVPKNPTTIKRLLHLISFAITSFFPLLLKCFSRPSAIMVVQPTLFCTPAVLLLCKLFGIKSILHIQDFELDAMFGTGLANADKQGLIKKMALKVERAILRSFDLVSTISHSMMNRAEQKGVAAEKLVFFPNWSDINFVTPYADNQKLRKEWNVKSDETVVLYAGNLGAKQGLELMLEAANALRDETGLRFFIVGSGANRDNLVKSAEAMNLTNVTFKSLVPWEDVPAMLTLADVHLVIQKKGVADAVLPSKLTNILSAGGHAVVTAEPETELGRIANKFPGIYTCVPPEDLAAFTAGLISEIASARQQKANQIARHYAEIHLAKDAILERFKRETGLLVENEIETSPEKG